MAKTNLIAINDIREPVRIKVESRNQLIQLLRGAHHFENAMEIEFDGVGSTYYICAMDRFNEGIRKEILSRAAQMLIYNTPHKFNEKIENNPKIPKHILTVRCKDNALIPRRKIHSLKECS